MDIRTSLRRKRQDRSAIRLILSADDAGMTPLVNDAIVSAAASGVLSAASVMAGMPFAADAVNRFRQRMLPIDVGAHFCLTSGRPVADPAELPMLVGADGKFRHGFGGLLRLAFSRQRNEFFRQVRQELDAQLEWFVARDVPIRFVDGHQHVHMIPGIFTQVREAVQQRGLLLRISDERIVSVNRLLRRWRHWLPGGLIKKTILSTMTRWTGCGRCGMVDAAGTNVGGVNGDGMNAVVAYHGVLDTGRFLLLAWESLFDAWESRRAGGSGGGECGDLTLLVNIHPATGRVLSSDASRFCMSPADERFVHHENRIHEWEAIIGEPFRELLRRYCVEIVRIHEQDAVHCCDELFSAAA